MGSKLCTANIKFVNLSRMSCVVLPEIVGLLALNADVCANSASELTRSGCCLFTRYKSF